MDAQEQETADVIDALYHAALDSNDPRIQDVEMVKQADATPEDARVIRFLVTVNGVAFLVDATGFRKA